MFLRRDAEATRGAEGGPGAGPGCQHCGAGETAGWAAVSELERAVSLSSKSLRGSHRGGLTAAVWEFEHSLALPFFRIGMKTDPSLFMANLEP